MLVFVWARAFCGIRYSCSASVDCSGAIRKIHLRNFRLIQGVAHACHHDGFWPLGTFDEAPGTVQSPGAALTRNVEISHGSKNLLQRGILNRHEKILLRQLRLQAQTQENYV